MNTSKMNGEIPSVPITTLAGVSSLTDLLPQLPLPSPLPGAVHNKSLLFHPKLAEEAKAILATRDENLISQLVHVLQQTNTEQIELKDSLAGENIDGEIPELLKGILQRDPNVFQSQKGSPSTNTPKFPYGQNASPYRLGTYAVHQQNNTSPHNHVPLAGGSKSSPPFAQPELANNLPSHSPIRHQSATADRSDRRKQTVNGDIVPSRSSRSSSFNHSKDVPPQPTVASPTHASAAESVAQNANFAMQESITSRSVTALDATHGSSSRSHSPRLKEAVISIANLNQSVIDKYVAPPKKRTYDPAAIEKKSSSVSFIAPSERKQQQTKTGNQPIVMLEPLDQQMIKFLTRTKRKRSGDDNESYGPGGTTFNDYTASLSDRVKRRRRQFEKQNKSRDDDESPDDGSGPEYAADVASLAARKRKKEKKHRRYIPQHLTTEELLDSATFKKFCSAIDTVFESAEEIDLKNIDFNDEDQECPEELLIPKGTISEICGEAAKLKSQGVMNQIPPGRLVKLLTVLQWNVRDGAKLLTHFNQDDDDDDETPMWKEMIMERVMRSMDSALTALYIMTSPNMPKKVYLEDVMETVLLFSKFHLHNSIYPEFDPVYRINKKEVYHGNFKLKRARAGQVKNKSSLLLYNKLTDLVAGLSNLIEIQEFTDTFILQASSLGVSTFFVENISELQLNAMKLITCIFSRYDKHRQLILDDIFTSLARLPSSKRNLRNYRLNADESIQMVTALALQLIQCVVKLPIPEDSSRPNTPTEENADKATSTHTEDDVIIVTSYENSMRTGYNFLTVFLKKCTTKGEEDYRPLFENFVHDLLSTVNKPDWPASELLLSLLGRILVKQFSSKSADMSVRTASLEYLGIVASRLRKDAVSSCLDQETIDEIVEKALDSDSDDSDEEVKKKPKSKKKVHKDQTQDLQMAMLEYLASNGHTEPALLFARQFYIAQWYRDTTMEAEKRQVAQDKNDPDFDDELEEERTTEVMHNTEKRKAFLLTQIKSQPKPFSSFKPAPSKLDYDNSCLVARYLSSQRPFAQSFDIYLTQILRVLSETAVAVRTKAMKCLTAVVEADPGILARNDMQKGVRGRFLDQSTSVREAAVELVGKFILIRPELIPNYYEMLSERILDTGISVRKRVIKIFKDICLEQPEYPKIPEMCVKMIRRVNDEEGIKKLVSDVFHTMWFTPTRTRGHDEEKLLVKVVNITEVVSACKDTGLDFFERLLDNLLKIDEDHKDCKENVTARSALLACTQIVDCLVENVLRIEEKTVELTNGKGTSSQRLIACLATLHLFSKLRPELMVKHATTLQPYINIKCSTQGDHLVLHTVAQILDVVVPIMEHPSESFLAQLEEDMVKLILKHGMMVLQSCVCCLGAVVNNVTHNYKLVKDLFQKFFGVLSKLKIDHEEDYTNPSLPPRKPTLLRSLFSVGLLFKNFDFDSKDMGETKVCIKDKVFDLLVYFLNHEDEDVRFKALTGIGYMCVRHYDFMMGRRLKDIYDNYLLNKAASHRLKCQVLKNLNIYLIEEEVKMTKADHEWKKLGKSEDLKEMGDIQSGMASTIMQVYLKQTLESFFHVQPQVRMMALSVICLVLQQGLVHPVQCVPYLITMGTDVESSIKVKADQQLQEIEKKYPGFIHMKALAGLKMSFNLQTLLSKDPFEPVRGYLDDDHAHRSLNSYLYTVLRSNRGQRRAFMSNLLNLQDDSARASLAEQLYVVDNLAFFPYLVQDEPLFAIHQIDIIVSVSGSNLLQSFRESLTKKGSERSNGKIEDEEDSEEDVENFIVRFPEDLEPLEDTMRLAQGCVLLLHLKQHLKETYGFTDNKVHQYSPTESAKIYDKPVTRKANLRFDPEQPIEVLRKDLGDQEDDTEARKTKLAEDFLDFKHLMLSIDPPDDDDDDEDRIAAAASSRTPPQQIRGAVAEGEDEDVVVIDAPNVQVMLTRTTGETILDPVTGEVTAVPDDSEPPALVVTPPRVPPIVIRTTPYTSKIAQSLQRQSAHHSAEKRKREKHQHQHRSPPSAAKPKKKKVPTATLR